MRSGVSAAGAGLWAVTVRGPTSAASASAAAQAADLACDVLGLCMAIPRLCECDTSTLPTRLRPWDGVHHHAAIAPAQRFGRARRVAARWIADNALQ
jgi:hypothetical protein